MSEFPWSETFTLVGVIVGFLLSQTAILIKTEKSKRSLKQAVITELTVAKDSISHAKNVGNMPKDRLPFVTAVYDSNIGKLASVFNAKQLSSIHMAYGRIKQVGSQLKTGNTLFRGYIELVGGDYVIYQHDLSEDIEFLDKNMKVL